MFEYDHEAFVASCFVLPFDPRTDPRGRVVRVRKRLEIDTERTDADYQAACDRMAVAAAQRIADTVVLPSIGRDLPAGCPIIPTPKPVTDTVRRGGRTFTAEEVNRASLEHRNREQAAFAAEFERRGSRRHRTPEAKPKTEKMGERIIAALSGADPLSTTAVRRVVGGRKPTVTRALNALLASGHIERMRVSSRLYLWRLSTGSEVSGTAGGGTPSPKGLGGSHPQCGQSHPPLTPVTPEPEEVEGMEIPDVVTVEGDTLEERAASIVKLLLGDRIEVDDFAVLAKVRRHPDFVRAWELVQEGAAA